MRVERSHHIDASQPDIDGMYEWYYEYDLFRFTEGEHTLVGRAYVDSSDKAQFLRLEEQGRIETITDAHLDGPGAVGAAPTGILRYFAMHQRTPRQRLLASLTASGRSCFVEIVGPTHERDRST